MKNKFNPANFAHLVAPNPQRRWREDVPANSPYRHLLPSRRELRCGNDLFFAAAAVLAFTPPPSTKERTP